MALKKQELATLPIDDIFKIVGHTQFILTFVKHNNWCHIETAIGKKREERENGEKLELCIKEKKQQEIMVANITPKKTYQKTNKNKTKTKTKQQKKKPTTHTNKHPNKQTNNKQQTNKQYYFISFDFRNFMCLNRLFSFHNVDKNSCHILFEYYM